MIWKLIFGDGTHNSKKNIETNEIPEKDDIEPGTETEKGITENKIEPEGTDLNS